MDQVDLPAADHRAALASLARLNWFSRSGQILAGPIRQTAAMHTGSRPLRVLDLACGGGDVLLSLARQMQRLGRKIEWTGLDISEVAVAHAREQVRRLDLPVEFIQADVLHGDWPRNCDVVMCSLFLHHLDETQALALLTRMGSEARQQVLINDLKRSRIGYVLAQAACRLLSRSSVVHYDGPVSVAGAFTIAEVQALAEQADLRQAKVESRWPQRWLLDWRRA
ncbi:methyltransferase domain-containing protein [Anatilimnocola floriformis]|uniref:methyltransferase domain-containing protein n=1 Tax=Anatilimnocola floriformis TaxID=2948575 RepID=UPI0020C30CCF|nr:methyltransferase domain-containing protein [Anatilimnocola floriformis]